MQKAYRDFRCTLHRHYKKFDAPGMARRTPYINVRPNDWEFLCNLFEEEKFQQRSAINSANRQKMLYSHRMGSKSFVSARYAQRDSETGEEPDRIEFFKRTRYNEKKGWISDEAESRYNRMMELQSQSTEEGSEPLTQDQICDTVLGTRSGYVCGLGHGPKPVGSSSRSRILESSNREMREELASQREKIQQIEARHEEFASQREKIQTMEARQQELEDLVMRLLSSSAPSAS